MLAKLMFLSFKFINTWIPFSIYIFISMIFKFWNSHASTIPNSIWELAFLFPLLLCYSHFIFGFWKFDPQMCLINNILHDISNHFANTTLVYSHLLPYSILEAWICYIPQKCFHSFLIWLGSSTCFCIFAKKTLCQPFHIFLAKSI